MGGDGFLNEAGATLNIIGTLVIGSTQADNADGIDNRGNITNTGSITVQQAFRRGIGNYLEGNFVNDGTITIRDTDNNSNFSIINENTFTNNQTIQIQRGSTGIDNLTEFINNGTIRIGTVAAMSDNAIRNTGIFRNNRTIDIQRATLFGLDNDLGGTFFNGTSGQANPAKLTIASASPVTLLTGIWTSGTVTNEGDIDIVASAGLAVNVVNAGTFNNNATGSLRIGTGGTAEDGGIGNRGDFNNSGTIQIDNTTAVGISCIGTGATFDNSSGGSIAIGAASSNVSGTGILLTNSGVLTNNDATITIGTAGSNTFGTGLSTQAPSSLANLNCGEVYLYARMINNGTITNDGLWWVETNANQGNEGTFTNNGVINHVLNNLIPDVTNNGLYSTPGSFVPTTTVANDLFLAGVANSFTVGTTWYTDEALTVAGGAFITNQFTATPPLLIGDNTYYFRITGSGCNFPGKMIIENTGLNPGSITWIGVIDSDWENPGNWSPLVVPGSDDPVIIPSTANDPLIGANVTVTVQSVEVETDATLHIAANGSLTIDGATNRGLFLNGNLNNNGAVSIDNCTNDAIEVRNSANVTNNGSIRIGATGSASNIGRYGLHIRGDWTNNSGASITIDHTTSHGILNTSTGLITNEGAIHVGQNGGSGSINDNGINNVGTLRNNATGAIVIDHTTGDAIFSNSAGNKGFINTGTVDIGQHSSPSAVAGAGIHADGIVTNASGTINIDGTGGDGIYCIGLLTNSGVINIGQNVRTFLSGIENQSTVRNTSCGEIRIGDSNEAPIENIAGASFENEGLIVLSSENTNINAGTFTNDGVINYTSDNLIPNLVNNDLLITVGTATGCTIDDVLVFGNTNDFVPATNWYTDEALTTLGATYDPATNTVTWLTEPNDSYFFAVSGNGCTFNTVALVLVTDTPPPTAVTWTGAVSTDWASACNWSPNVLPTAATDVTIPVTTNQPEIMAGTVATSKSVTITSGARLDIASSGSLAVAGSVANGLLVDGTLNNSGTLSINNCGTNGVEVGTTGEVDNFASITIGDASSTNPSVQGGMLLAGDFVNHTNATINIDRTNSEGILCSSSGDFTNSGNINIGQTGGPASTGDTGLLNLGTFTNNDSGTLTIDHTGSDAIGNTSGGNKGFFNFGTIDIGQNFPIAGSGINIRGRFRNLSGTINIDATAGDGIRCTGNLNTTGSINIGQNVGILLTGIYNEGTIEARPCGAIRIGPTQQAPISNASGANFTNSGLLAMVSNQANVNNGTFTNNAVINYASDNVIPNLINNGLFITVGIATDCNISGGIVAGATNSYAPATNWYKDEALTVLGATYDAVSQTATPIGVPCDTYFFQVSGSGCTFNVVAVVALNRLSPSTITWTGNVSSDWADPCNWEAGQVPTADQGITIPITTNQPEIESGTAAVGKSLIVKAGATLDIANTASLQLAGANGNGLRNAGTITNNGTLALDDCVTAVSNETGGTLSNFGALRVGATGAFTNTGIANDGTIINQTGATINVDRFFNDGSGNLGIGLLTNGTITNFGTINIGSIASAGSTGLSNGATGTFTNEASGELNITNTLFFAIGNFGVSFTNRGRIFLSSIANATLSNFTNFTNEACALIDIASDDGIGNGGTFINDGNIIENGSGNSSITTNNGTVQNLNGGTFSIDTNNGVVVTAPGLIWTGCTDTDWTKGDNWITKTVPTGSDDVYIPVQNNLPTITNGSVVLAKSVEIVTNATLTIRAGGKLNISGATGDALAVAGLLTNGGTIGIGQNGGAIGRNGMAVMGEVENTGIIAIDITSAVGLSLDGTGTKFINAGILDVGTNLGIAGRGIMLGAETEFTNQTGGTVRVFGDQEGISNLGIFNNAGDLLFDNILNNAITGIGTFTNTGVLGGNARNISLSSALGGTLSPGFSPGSITFEAGQSFLEGTTLLMELAGTGFNEADRLLANGIINLNNIDLRVSVNYVPQDGDRIDLITASVITGNFASVSLPDGWELLTGPSVAVRYNVSLLPVELVRFTAEKVDKTVRLDWETTEEVDNEGFEIQHSTDGARWEMVGFVMGSGNTSAIQAYQYVHVDPVLGDNYYRLRQLDFDGQVTDSPIRVVNFENLASADALTVFPNPTRDVATVTLPREHGPGRLVVINNTGQIISNYSITTEQIRQQLDASMWPAGTYTVQVMLSERTLTSRLVK
ncbi:MAG: T9SS type A sorting domain-containing protein [Bacteroidota bacterium]